MSNLLSARWLSYHLEVLPWNAGETQVVESRRAFYAGALAVLAIMAAIGDDDSIDEEAGAQVLRELHREIHRFYEQIGKTT